MTTIIAATNRPHSYTLKLAEYYKKTLGSRNYPVEIVSLADVPDSILHNNMYAEQDPEFAKIQEVVNATSKFIFIVPEYNGGFPGVLKVFIDACRYPDSFYGKKAVLVGLSSGKYGNIRGLEHLTGICHYMNMHILPLKLHIPYIKQEFDSNGNLSNADTIKYTNQQMEQLIPF